MENNMKIYLGADHAGYELKEKLKVYLGQLGHEVNDMGAFALNPTDDYPDFVRPVAEAVISDHGSFGIIFGKSGQGEAMDANRVLGARAIEYYGGDLEVVSVGRMHNNANILSIGAGFVTMDAVIQVVAIFLETPFEGGRHEVRIEKLDQ